MLVCVAVVSDVVVAVVVGGCKPRVIGKCSARGVCVCAREIAWESVCGCIGCLAEKVVFLCFCFSVHFVPFVRRGA